MIIFPPSSSVLLILSLNKTMKLFSLIILLFFNSFKKLGQLLQFSSSPEFIPISGKNLYFNKSFPFSDKFLFYIKKFIETSSLVLLKWNKS